MESCACGVARRQFWVWQDSGGGIHASTFRPSAGLVVSVWAATARDALLPLGQQVPRHVVTDANDPERAWDGRCVLAGLGVG